MPSLAAWFEDPTVGTFSSLFFQSICLSKSWKFCFVSLRIHIQNRAWTGAILPPIKFLVLSSSNHLPNFWSYCHLVFWTTSCIFLICFFAGEIQEESYLWYVQIQTSIRKQEFHFLVVLFQVLLWLLLNYYIVSYWCYGAFDYWANSADNTEARGCFSFYNTEKTIKSIYFNHFNPLLNWS